MSPPTGSAGDGASKRAEALAKKIGRTYEYYLNLAGRSVMTAWLKLETVVLIPELAGAMAT